MHHKTLLSQVGRALVYVCALLERADTSRSRASGMPSVGAIYNSWRVQSAITDNVHISSLGAQKIEASAALVGLSTVFSNLCQHPFPDVL